MSIANWPEGERPRERLLRHGASALSDAELLAIFLRVGMRGKNAIDLARDLLARHGGQLGKLAEASIAELARCPGIGLAKASQLKASFELAQRAIAESLQTGEPMTSPTAVQQWLQMHLAYQQRELFVVLWLDTQHRLIRWETLSFGTLNQAPVFPREVVKAALSCNAGAAIFAHNHPSGVNEPSSADQGLTSVLKKALALVDVKVLDHFVISQGQPPVSFTERGLL